MVGEGFWGHGEGGFGSRGGRVRRIDDRKIKGRSYGVGKGVGCGEVWGRGGFKE